MTYTFEIPTGWPDTKQARQILKWRLEAHLSRHRLARRLGVGWVWRLHRTPTSRFGPMDVWSLGRSLARQIAKHTKAELYSTGQRVVLGPGDQKLTITLEVS